MAINGNEDHSAVDKLDMILAEMAAEASRETTGVILMDNGQIRTGFRQENEQENMTLLGSRIRTLSL